MPERELTERIEQLRDGTTGAAAALPDAYVPLGERAVEAAERLVAVARGGAAGDGPARQDAPPAERLREALGDLEELHYRLVHVDVYGDEDGEPGIEALLERMGEHLDALGATEGPSAA